MAEVDFMKQMSNSRAGNAFLPEINLFLPPYEVTGTKKDLFPLNKKTGPKILSFQIKFRKML